MNGPTPPTAAVEATEQLIADAGFSHWLPATDSQCVTICHELGYQCDVSYIEHLRAGCFIPSEGYGPREITMLLASLESRKRWRVGFHDDRKSRARLAIERGAAEYIDETLLSCLRYDAELLLTWLESAHDMSKLEVQTICEVLRHRMGITQTASAEAQEPA